MKIVYFRNFRSEHLKKDIGFLLEHFSSDGALVTHKSIADRSLMPSSSFTVGGDGATATGFILLLMFIKTNIDSLHSINLIHVTRRNVLICAFAKMLKKEVLTYIKGDINFSGFVANGQKFWPSRISDAFYQRLFAKVDCVSVELRQAVIPVQRLMGEKSHVFWLPNSSRLSPPPDVDRKKKTVLFVGRLGCPHKNVELLYNLAPELIFNDWQIKLVGNFVENGQLSYDAFVSTNAVLQEKILYCGAATDDATLRSYYHEACFLVMTSVSEGFPLVVPEAMAHGCALLLPTLPFTADVIDGNGYVFDGEGGLKSILNRIFSSEPDDFLEMQERSRLLYIESFSRPALHARLKSNLERQGEA